jgi:hypothetical protein
LISQNKKSTIKYQKDGRRKESKEYRKTNRQAEAGKTGKK